MKCSHDLIRAAVCGLPLVFLAACGGDGGGGVVDAGVEVPPALSIEQSADVELSDIAQARSANLDEEDPPKLNTDNMHRQYVGQFRKNDGVSPAPIAIAYRQGTGRNARIVEVDEDGMATDVILELRGLRSDESIDGIDKQFIDDLVDTIDGLDEQSRREDGLIDELGEGEDSFVFTRRLPDDTLNIALVALQEYSALGFWASDIVNLQDSESAPTSQVAMFHFGFNAPTSGANARPTTGSAVYHGHAFGYYYSGSGNEPLLILTEGESATFAADFADNMLFGRIKSDDVDIVGLSPSGVTQPETNLDIDFTVTRIEPDNTFMGSIPAIIAGGALAGINGETGSYEGALYGPKGEEISGTLGVGDVGDGNPRLVLGFFGSGESVPIVTEDD